jgi:hypothetical protein
MANKAYFNHERQAKPAGFRPKSLLRLIMKKWERLGRALARDNVWYRVS